MRTGPILIGEGWPYLTAVLILAVLSAVAGLTFLAAGFGAGFLFLTAFFRNPRRQPPGDRYVAVSPADGIVIKTSEAEDGSTKVAIFMSVFNVHVNRVPMGGKLLSVDHRPGSFLKADHPEAGEKNEQNVLTFQTPAGMIFLKQIAGILARRTVCWLTPGMEVTTGQAFGMIKFSSRVEVTLPPGGKLAVAHGDRVYGGKTVISRYESLKKESG